MAETKTTSAGSEPNGEAGLNASTSSDPKKGRPEKPDEEAYKTNLSKAEKEHASAMEKLNAIKAKIDAAKPGSKAAPSSAQQRQQELRSQLSSIRQQQQGFKSSKGSLQEKIRQLDATLKSRIAEQNNARGKFAFKSVDELDREIQRLDKLVEAGTMKIVDENKTLADISNLRKQKKGFAALEEQQKGIDHIKAQLSELRKGLEDPEAKALSEKYSVIAKELDEIKAEQDTAYKGINALRDERSKLHAQQQEKYLAIRALKDEYYAQKKAYSNYEHEAYLARKERQKAERDGYEKERRRKIAEKKLEEASEPAFINEILTAEGLIRYFDPTVPIASDKSSPDRNKLAAQASRTVDNSNAKGTLVKKKDDTEENYFMGTGGKKGKKGRKSGANSQAGAVPEGGKFNLSIGVIEELGKVDIEPPMSQAGVPAVVEKLQAKLAHWKKDRDRQTKENIEKARKEIERLEAEPTEPSAATTSGSSAGTHNNSRAKDTPRKPAAANGESTDAPSAGAELAQEKDAAADAAEDLKKARLEDTVK
ncbi:MAG: hypothetical protein M1825_001573 [Sarcosagium campestre]|nr:MAG: hypothetical protein M1825_001573 [Sarcosagium campestre]